MIHHYALGNHWLQLDTASDHLCLVNTLAAEIVQLRESGTTGEALVQALLQRYDVQEERLRADVNALLAGLAPPAEVVFRDTNGYVAEVAEVPQRALRPVASTILHLPGFEIHVSSESAAVIGELDRLFRLTPSTASQMICLQFRLYCEDGDCLIVLQNGTLPGTCLDTGHDTADTVVKCLRCINLQCALALPGTCFVHAAAVARGDRALLLPARGGSGKSTLAASLVQRGDTLVNDDIVSLSLASAALIPVPTSLSVKQGSWAVLAELWANGQPPLVYGHTSRQLRYWPPTDLQACSNATHCSLVVVPSYSPNCDGSHLSSLSPEDVLSALLEAGASLDRPVRPVQLEQLCRWLNGVSAWRLSYADLDQAHAAIDRLWQALPGQLT